MAEMRVWARTELLCIHFDGLKVQLDQWPISLSNFQAMVIDRAMDHFNDSSCLFVEEELNRFRNESRKIASVLRKRCRLFKKVHSGNPVEITNLSIVQWDDDIYLSLGDWDGGYDTELVSTDDSEEEIHSWEGWLLEGEGIVGLFDIKFRKFWWRNRLREKFTEIPKTADVALPRCPN